MVAAAAGCGDDSSDESAAAGSGGGSGGGGGGGGGGGSGGTTISISGTPPAQIMQGEQFTFTPTVVNPGGLTLTFTATNLPGWAAINSSSGQVTGTPGQADVGVYANIRVTVSGGGQSVTSPAYTVTVVSAASGSALLTWLPPTQNADGSQLTDLAGYKIYWGQSPGNLSNSVTVANPGLSSYVVDQLTPATWYFAAAAYNTGGAESVLSNIGSKTIL